MVSSRITLCWRGAVKEGFCKDFEVWFCNLAYLQKKKKEEKDQCSIVDHTGKTLRALPVPKNVT